MLSQQELQGNWDKVKGRVQEQWGQLDENELESVRGNFNQLVGVIEQKTGETRRKIETFVEEIAKDTSSVVEKVSGAARTYASQAGGSAQEYYQQAAESVAEGYQQVQNSVRRRPTETIAVTFAAGIIAGALLGIVLRSR